MQPNHSEMLARRREDVCDRRPQRSLDMPAVSRSATSAQWFRSEGKLDRGFGFGNICRASSICSIPSCVMYSLRLYTDSWIEISSQPSSSSLSSAGEHEIVATGL